MTTLALVPARGGSKGVPGKNIRPLAGRPLIAWTIACARACPSLDRVVVSTDDEEIAEIARTYGAEVPFRRPVALAADDVGDFPVYRHALDELGREGYEPDAVVFLRPTAPLRLPEDVEGALELLRRTDADAVRSVCVAEHHPYWMKRFEDDRLLPFTEDGDEWRYPRRQELPLAYRLNGAVDAVRVVSVPETGPLFAGEVRGFVMPAERSVDIDAELDFVIAEAIAGRSTA